MDYLDKEVIPDFLGGECVVSVAAGRGLGLQRSTEAGVGPHPCECGCRHPERSHFLFLGAGLVFKAAPKRGESSPKEGPYLGFFKHSDPDGSFWKCGDQASQRFILVFPIQYVARQQSEFTC